MFPVNSPFPKQVNQSSYLLKSSFSENIKENISNNLFSEIPFQTPVKEVNNSPGNTSFSPFRIDFDYFFGNSCSKAPLSINPINNSSYFSRISPNKEKLFEDKDKDYFLIRKSAKKSGSKISPESMKENRINNSLSYKTKFIFSSENQSKIRNNENPSNYTIINRINLFSLFNKERTDNSFFSSENDYINNDLEKYGNENKFSDKKNNVQLFSLNTPKKISNNNSLLKKLFECSNSTFETALPSSNNKRKRLRKNNNQLFLLKKFYTEHKNWNKSQIKEISSQIGLKENKIYKWLWDQRNKESKSTKFIVNKKGGKIDE